MYIYINKKLIIECIFIRKLEKNLKYKALKKNIKKLKHFSKEHYKVNDS